MKKKIEEYISSNWGNIEKGGQAPPRLSSLVISQPHGRDHEKGKMTQIVFAEGDENPILVAKYCKSRAYEYSLKKEVEAIKGLEKSGLKGYAPEIAGMAEVDGKEVLFLRPVQGRAISLQIKELALREGWDSPELKALVRGYFDLAAGFLGKLGFLGGDDIVVAGETIRTDVEPVISRYIKGLGINGQEEHACYGTLELFKPLIGKKIHPRLMHGDFTPSNLFLADDREHLVAIDWEFARREGLYSLDAPRFLYYCYEDIAGLVITQDAREGHFIETFIRRGNWYGELAFDFASSVLGEFGLDYKNYKSLLGLFLIHEYSLQSDMARFPDIHQTASIRRRVNYLTGSDASKGSGTSKAEKVDIIVPVFNALDDLRACVDSVLADTDGDFRLVLIDDCSTDPAVAEYLKTLEARNIANLEIKYNAENLGFVKTANRGMRQSGSDVVLLNSDTVVTPRWLGKMKECAYSDETIASVTPLTNNGSICSVPRFYEDNPLPEGMSAADMAALVERASKRSYPKIPIAVGFCMYIKRAALERVGYFDEETFGRGYEEENDWCMRARALGYTHALDDSTFIYHKGSMSFTGDSAGLKERNAKITLEKYPDYKEVVGGFITRNPLRDIQENIRLQIKRARTSPGEGSADVPTHDIETRQEAPSRQTAAHESIWPAMKRIVPHPIKWFIKYKILGAPQRPVEQAAEMSHNHWGRILTAQIEKKLPLRPAEEAVLGVNVAGYFRGEFGVAEAARADVRSLESAGIPYVLNDIAAPGYSDLDRAVREFSSKNPYKFNLVHVNADAVYNFSKERGPVYFEGKYSIGYWNWELSTFPDKFLASFDLFDEIWTPSAFCVDSISRVSRIPVIRMPYSIDVDPMKTTPARGRFGLGEDEFIFLVTFDFHSVYERKNPFAAIRSFRKAFGKHDKVKLVVKHINSGEHPAELEAFNKELNGLNVTVIESYLRKEELHSLFASCNCYVSLHRSEGFGLTIAEAMALGKPVIATAYSGNTDFMDINNSLPVKYSLVELDRDYPPFYEKGAVWADPDVDHAAMLMRKVYEDKGFREDIGARAAQSIRERLSPGAVGRLYRERLEHLAAAKKT